MARVLMMFLLGSVTVSAQSPAQTVEAKKTGSGVMENKTSAAAKTDASSTGSGNQNGQMQKQEEKKFKTGPYDREGNYTIELEEKDADLPD